MNAVKRKLIIWFLLSLIPFTFFLLIFGAATSFTQSSYEHSETSSEDPRIAAITEIADKYSMSEYIDLILAIIRVSNSSTPDIMLASEFSYNTSGNAIEEEAYSIKCGVRHLRDLLEKHEVQDNTDYENIRKAVSEYTVKKDKEAFAGSVVAYIEYIEKTKSKTGSTGTFDYPMKNHRRVSSDYGYRIHPIYGTRRLHGGTDFPAPSGTDILASDGGNVSTAGYHYSFGNYIIIKHSNGFSTLYAHNSKLLVKKGDSVSKGQVIAKCGSTGDSTGPHCHFEIRVNGTAVNPMGYYGK